VTGEQIVLVGSVLGANLAIKAAAIHPEISRVVAISPVLNVYDVLSVNPLRAYGARPLLMVAGAGSGRQYKEFLLLNDIAKRACGKENAAVIIESAGFGPKLITKYNVRRVLDWILNPRLPEILEVSSSTVDGLEPAPADQAETQGLSETQEDSEESSGKYYPNY
jgi:pimeloyl-ACP methyl ester carboxylesterase